MQSAMKTVQTNAMVQAILFVLVGLVFLVVPGITLITVAYILGAVFVVSGGVSLASYFRESSPGYKMSGPLIAGIFLLALALIMFVFPQTVASLLTIVLGAVLILCGIANVVRSAGLREFSGNAWIFGVIVGILVMVAGVLVIWNPFGAAELLVRILGIALLVNGVADLAIEATMRKNLSA